MEKKFILTLVMIMAVVFGFSQTFEKQGAGVTFIVHGWNPDGDQPLWMSSMANAIIDRSGGDGQIATITVTGSTGNLTATCSDWDFSMATATSGQIVVLINWTSVANHLTTFVTAQEVAAAVTPKIFEPQNGQAALAELPIHLIGHSRGGGMVYEIARLLGLQAIEVDHLTSLDPHPLTEADPQPLMGTHTIDTPVEIYENILFADNYYQNIEFPTGEYVTGAFNRLWESLPGGYHNETGYTYNILGSNYNFSDHLNIILMYHGTTDLASTTTNGEATMTQTERDAWFNTYEAQGEIEGFYYSSDVAGDRKSIDSPVVGGDQIIDGFHNNVFLGGNGARQTLDWTNAVWSNVLTINIIKNSEVLQAGSQALYLNEQIQFQNTCRSYDNSCIITVYVDIDRNPYNDNNVSMIDNEPQSSTSSNIAQSSMNWTVTGLNTGTNYYFYAEINNGTYKRYIYSSHEFHIAEYYDLSVININKPVKNFTADMPVTITIENLGTTTQTGFPVSYIFNGDTVNEIFTQSIEAGQTSEYTFSQTIDLSTEAIYDISANTGLVNDEDTGNDEFSTQINTYINPNTLFFIYDDYISVPNNAALSFTDNFTIETWFYSHSTKALGKVISKHGNDGTRSGYSIEYDGINIKSVIGIGGGWAVVEAPINANQWYHVALVYGAGTLEMYLNGVSQGTANGTILTNNLDLYIGSSQQYGDSWTGYIEELRIWNDVRSTTEIQENMNTEINPLSENLLAYYDFNRGIPKGDNTAIEFLPDMTDNNYHGRMHNFALQAGLSDGNFFEDCNLDISKPKPDVPVLNNITGECSATVTETPTATDNCNGVITGTTSDPLTYSESGTYTVTWSYDDGNGNISTQEQTIIVDDLTAPVADISTLEDVTGECSATVTETPTATDNCNGVITGTTSDPLTYSESGTYAVTWSYDDGNGNISTQEQTIIVNDLTAPVADISTLEDVTGECSATVTETPTATDNCNGVITGTTSDPLTYSESGIYTVTWSYDDGNGNISTQEQTVIVNDLTAPAADISTLEDVTGECSATVTETPTATDNCNGVITGTTSDPLTYSESGIYTITWSYEDGNGNISTQEQTIKVNDLTAPVADISTLEDVTGECSATVTETPTATDNCNGVITGTTSDPLIYSELGTYTVTWFYDDGSGNISTQEQTVTVEDLTDPIPDAANLDDITAECEVTTLAAPTALDNCAGAITGTTTDPLTYTEQGSYIVTWSYDDGNGNIATQEQTVIIDDITDPTVSCIENQSIDLNEGETFYTVQGAEFDPNETTDNCELASIENDFNNSATLAGEELPEGTNTIVWTVTDIAGNTNSCQFDVVVNPYVGMSNLSANGITVYPNPTKGVIHISYSTGKEIIKRITLTDITGKIIQECSNLKGQQSHFDISDQANNVYILKIITSGGIITKKIIKN